MTQREPPPTALDEVDSVDHRRTSLRRAAGAACVVLVFGSFAPDPWAFTPTMLGSLTAGWLYARAGRAARRRTMALVGSAIAWMLMTFAGTRLFPGADHHHSGPERGTVYLVAAVLAVACFTAINLLRAGRERR